MAITGSGGGVTWAYQVEARGVEKTKQKLNSLQQIATKSQREAMKTGQQLRGYQQLQGQGIKLTNDQTKAKQGLEQQYRKTGNSLGTLYNGQQKSIMAAAKWGLAWTLVYGAIRLVMGSIQAMIGMLIQLDDTLVRVGTVTRFEGRNVEKTMERMRKAVFDYAYQSRASIQDTAKALYFLGSAGLDVEQQLAGMEHIMNLTVGTVGNLDEAAKLVAGAFNVFNKQLQHLSSESARFQHISDTLAYTYRTQQVELNELASAYTLVGSAAGLLQVDFQLLTTTIGFLNTGMLKGCYSKDTEILTDQGWKFFKDLNKTEKVATLNPRTKNIEYQKPYEYIDEPYKGKMYRVKGKYIDLLVTPNHKIYSSLGRKKYNKKYKLRRADEVFGKEQTFIRGAKWKGKNPKYFILPSVELHHGGYTQQSGKIKIKIKDWIQFLAWWLSEGCLSSTKENDKTTHYKVKIYQAKGRKRNKIRELLKNLPFNFYESKSKKRTPAFIINSKQLYSYLKQFGKSYNKYIPQFIKELSPGLLKLFIETYTLGDGRKRKNCIEITTISKKLRDDLEEIGLKAGYGVSHTKYPKYKYNTTFNQNYDIWKIYLSNRTEFTFNQKKNLNNEHGYNHTTIEKWENYDGRQYCVEVPNHVLFVRRNGKTVWCGNTRAGTALLNTFVKIAQNSQKLTKFFGITFDPDKPLKFYDTLERLHNVMGDAALSTDELRVLIEVFGLRGQRAIASILGRWEEYEKAIESAREKFGGSAEEMAEMMGKSLPGLLATFTNQIKIDFATIFDPAVEGLKKVVLYLTQWKTAGHHADRVMEELAEQTGIATNNLSGMTYEFKAFMRFMSGHKYTVQEALQAIGEKGTAKQIAIIIALETHRNKTLEEAIKLYQTLGMAIEKQFEAEETDRIKKQSAYVRLAQEEHRIRLLQIRGLKDYNIALEKMDYLLKQADDPETRKKQLDYIKLQNRYVEAIAKEYWNIVNTVQGGLTDSIFELTQGTEEWGKSLGEVADKLTKMVLDDFVKEFIIDPIFDVTSTRQMEAAEKQALASDTMYRSAELMINAANAYEQAVERQLKGLQEKQKKADTEKDEPDKPKTEEPQKKAFIRFLDTQRRQQAAFHKELRLNNEGVVGGHLRYFADQVNPTGERNEIMKLNQKIAETLGRFGTGIGERYQRFEKNRDIPGIIKNIKDGISKLGIQEAAAAEIPMDEQNRIIQLQQDLADQEKANALDINTARTDMLQVEQALVDAEAASTQLMTDASVGFSNSTQTLQKAAETGIENTQQLIKNTNDFSISVKDFKEGAQIGLRAAQLQFKTLMAIHDNVTEPTKPREIQQAREAVQAPIEGVNEFKVLTRWLVTAFNQGNQNIKEYLGATTETLKTSIGTLVTSFQEKRDESNPADEARANLVQIQQGIVETETGNAEQIVGAADNFYMAAEDTKETSMIFRDASDIIAMAAQTLKEAVESQALTGGGSQFGTTSMPAGLLNRFDEAISGGGSQMGIAGQEGMPSAVRQRLMTNQKNEIAAAKTRQVAAAAASARQMQMVGGAVKGVAVLASAFKGGQQGASPLMGALGGAMAGWQIGSLFGPVGMGVGALIGGIAGGLSSWLGGKSRKKEEPKSVTKERVINIESQLKITNRSLDIINRNIVGIRRDLEGYMMPESYYFRARRGTNLADNFATGMSRGYA